VDKQIVALLIPIFALAIPISAIIFHGLQKLARMRLEEARLQQGPRDKGTEAEITLLREEGGDLRRELSDVQERLDFAERLLSRTHEVERLPGGPEPKA
jgi:Tfp pilus assembly protein PilO